MRVERGVTINGVALSREQALALAELERHGQPRLADGDYWYDRLSGAAGRAGRPTEMSLPPGLPFPSVIPPDASYGTTGVFLNGRELPQSELHTLEVLVGPLLPGRYFADSLGFIGLEGGPPAWNLVQAAHARAGVRHHDDEEEDSSL